MTDPVNNEQNPTPTEPTPSVLGAPSAEPNPSDSSAEPTDPVVTTGAPESIDGYEVNVEGFDFDEFKAIEENQAFLERAREAGLDNNSLNFLLGEYNQLIPQVCHRPDGLEDDCRVSKQC